MNFFLLFVISERNLDDLDVGVGVLLLSRGNVVVVTDTGGAPLAFQTLGRIQNVDWNNFINIWWFRFPEFVDERVYVFDCTLDVCHTGSRDRDAARREDLEGGFGFAKLVCHSRMNFWLIAGELPMLLRELCYFDRERKVACSQDVDHAIVKKPSVEPQLLK